MSTRVNDGRRKNWFWLDNVIIDKYAKQIGPYGTAVYAYLCRRANEDGQAWPSNRTISSDLGMSRNTVLSAVRTLQECGLVAVEVRRKDDGSHDSTLYTLQEVVHQTNQGGSRDEPGVVHDTNQGGSPDEPKENPKKKKKENPTNVGAAGAATADEFIVFLAEELDTADVPYTRGWKGRHGKQFKECLNKGTPESTLYKACDRIVERWTGEEHRKLTLDQALEDVVNGRPPRHLSAVGSVPTPDQYIASIERHPELGRYAGILRQWDFTSPDNPPYKIEVQLGGTQDERWRNLARLRSLIPTNSQGVASGR